MRAVFEICLKRGWAVPAKAALDMCKMVERRMWVLIRLLLLRPIADRDREGGLHDASGLDAYFCDPEIDELIGIQKAGRLVHRLVHRFPKL